MQIAVYDTHVRRPDGRLMHFDILVPTATAAQGIEAILTHGRLYLAAKGVPADTLDAQVCRYCHGELATPEVAAEITATGFAIIELAHCD